MGDHSAVHRETKAAREPGLDLLRTIAILLVVLYHMSLQPAPRFLRVIDQTGWMGVDLFFVLSGFLIGSQLLRPYLRNEFGARYWEMIYFPTYARLDGLLVGVLLAGIRSFRPVWWRFAMAWRGIALILALIVLSLSVWLCWGLYSFSAVVFGFPLIGLGFGFLVVAGAGLRVRIPGATMGATLAYSTYLTHKAVMHLDRVCLGHWLNVNWMLNLTIYAVTSLAFASILYLCIEGPFLRLRERAISALRIRRRAVPSAPSLAHS